jgi:hypothetical protein
VVADKVDVDYALAYVDILTKSGFVGMFLFSPMDARRDKFLEIKKQIADINYSWLDKVVFSLQLHKIVKMA